jgi:hypothetical protein
VDFQSADGRVRVAIHDDPGENTGRGIVVAGDMLAGGIPEAGAANPHLLN